MRKNGSISSDGTDREKKENVTKQPAEKNKKHVAIEREAAILIHINMIRIVEAYNFCIFVPLIKPKVVNMKASLKKMLMSLFFVGAAFTASAQSTPHSFGIHFGGSTWDLEYQYHFSQKNFLDVTAGAFMYNDGFNATATYNWNIKQWDHWCDKISWKLWGGVGGQIGWTQWDKYDGVYLGPMADLGFGFTGKNVPFTFGVDYRPAFLLCIGNETGILTPGFYNLGLTLTYQF